MTGERVDRTTYSPAQGFTHQQEPRTVGQQRISSMHDDTEKGNVTTSSRRSADEVPEFYAPIGLPQNLQKVVVDLVELHRQSKQAHWNLVGTNFRDLHLATLGR